MKDLRTADGIPAAKRRNDEWTKERNAHKRVIRGAFERAGEAWQPIETCPFQALAIVGHGLDCYVWVSDGKDVALASVKKRFGRPVRVVTPPRLSLTDNGLAWVGGEYAEIPAPDWWFQWELQNRLERYTERGEEFQSDVDFIATHWKPAMPKPPGVA